MTFTLKLAQYIKGKRLPVRASEEAFVLPMVLSFMVIISVLGLTLMQSSLQANSLAIRHSYVQMAHIASSAAIDFAEEQFEIDAAYLGTPEFTIAVTENYRITIEVEHLYFQNPPSNTQQRVRAWGRVYIPEISVNSDFAREINASVVRNGEVVGAVDPSDFAPLVWLDASDQNVLQQGVTSGTQFIDSDTSAVAASVVEQRGADADTSPGSLNFSSSDLEFSFDNATTGHQSVGLRFEDLDTPQGIEVNSAYIQLTADEVSNAPSEVQLTVEGVDSDTAPIWGGLFAVDTAPKTTTSILWEPPEWNVVNSSGVNERIDVTDIVKEIIDRPGWSPGNDIAFTATYTNGPGERTASKSTPPQLFVDWGVGGEAIATNDPVRLWQDSSINGNDAEFFSVSTSGSVTPGFLPTSLNPDAWYDAEQVVPSDLDASDNLLVWTDLSGNENNALSPGAATGASVEDNFDPGVDSLQWSNITGGSTDAVCGSSSGNAYRFTSGSNRRAETVSLDTQAGGTINFHLQMQASNSGGCNAIESGEDVVLEYSTNGGSNWTNIATYQVGSYNSYTPVSLNIPSAAQSSSTSFRWRQISFSSGNYDHWGIDDVAITANSSSSDQPPSFDDTTNTVNFDGATPEYLLLENTLDLDDFSVFVVSEQSATSDSPQLGDGSSLIGAIQDNFDPTQDNSQWTSLTGGSEDASCGNPSENGFLFDNPFSRFAETIDANTEFGGTIDFDLYMTHQNSGPCNAIESGEDVVLEYSTNGGSNWTNIATYQVNSYNDYTAVSEAIPAAAQAPNTRFRWRQASFSSGDFDHWGLDNVFVNISQPTSSSGPITYTATAPGMNFHANAPAGGIANINNGNISTSGNNDYEVHPINANGKTITMTFDQVMDVEQATFYNRTGCCRGRISNAEMIFRDSGGNAVFTFTFPSNTNANQIDIAPPSGTVKNVASVELTNFQGNSQNFREIIFTGISPTSGSNGFIEHAADSITYSSDATGIEHTTPAASSGFNVWSAGRSADQFSSSINGTNNSAVTADTESFSLAQIGAVEATNGFTGGIKEVIVYPRLLSAAERQEVEGYLAHKWGLDAKLPGSHPFKSVDPGEDVTTGGSGTSSPPTLETNALAGRNIVRFQNQSLLNIDLTNPIDSSAVTMFLVARAKPGSANDARLISAMADADITDLTSSSGFVGLKRIGGSPSAHQFYDSNAGQDLSSVFNNSWAVYTSVISSAQPERLLSNGVENENDIITSTSFNADEIFIAGTRFGSSSGTNIAEVDIAEVVVYDDYIACNAINDLEEYFSLKYGIATTVKSC